MLILKSESINPEKIIPERKTLPLIFVGGTTHKGRTCKTNGEWYQKILVAVVTEVYVPV